MVLDEVEKVLEAADGKNKRKAMQAKEGVKSKPKKKKLTKKEQQILDMAAETILPNHYKTIWTEEDLYEMAEWLKKQPILAVDTETLGTNPYIHEIVGISFYAPHKGFYIPLMHKDNEVIPEGLTESDLRVGENFIKCLPKKLVADVLKPILEDINRKLLLHNATFDAHVFRLWMSIDIMKNVYYDTMIGAKLLDENVPASLKEQATKYLKIPSDKFNTLFGKITFNKVPILMNPTTRTGNLATFYATKDTELTWKLWEFQKPFFEKAGFEELKHLLYNIELPFQKIVYKAEVKGIAFDIDYMKNEVEPQIRTEIEELRQQIWNQTGEINLRSSAQVSEALYIKLKIPPINKKKPKSTDKKTLTKLAKKYQIADLILKYRASTKLYDAFITKLPERVIDGRLHPSFNSIGTKTGRPSCKNPNLLQIPSGKLIRHAFVADEGRLLSSHDYGAQELRVLAHISKDPVLMDVYLNGKDVHAMTGVMVYNLNHPDDITNYDEFQYCRSLQELFLNAEGDIDDSKFEPAHLQQLLEEGKINTVDINRLKKDTKRGIVMEKSRKKAKTVNFAIVYGTTAMGLSDTLDISEEEAQSYIDGFYNTYKGVAKWVEVTKKSILKNKYTKSLMGRKRRLYPLVDSGEKWKLFGAFRQGCNAVIQASSADMSKKAAIDMQPYLEEIGATILLFIYDEFVIDVPENIGVEGLRKISQYMIDAIPLDCGMTSDIEVGKRWNDKMSNEDIEALAKFRQMQEEEDIMVEKNSHESEGQ